MFISKLLLKAGLFTSNPHARNGYSYEVPFEETILTKSQFITRLHLESLIQALSFAAILLLFSGLRMVINGHLGEVICDSAES